MKKAIDPDHDKNVKEWEEALCPICLEAPHNAVLLRCSSMEIGCRPYICNTGVRHSDCLRHFYCSSAPSAKMAVHQDASDENSEDIDTLVSFKDLSVSCPFCRGHVQGWEVIQPARKYMDSRLRSCLADKCGFSGNYAELRRHVRSEHPAVNAREVDPTMQQDWRRMEQETEARDLRILEIEEFRQRSPIRVSAGTMGMRIMVQLPNGEIVTLLDWTRDPSIQGPVLINRGTSTEIQVVEEDSTTTANTSTTEGRH